MAALWQVQCLESVPKDRADIRRELLPGDVIVTADGVVKLTSSSESVRLAALGRQIFRADDPSAA